MGDDTEWGDEIRLRPEGCSVCHHFLISEEAFKCYQCGAEFTPLVPPSHPPHGRQDGP